MTTTASRSALAAALLLLAFVHSHLVRRIVGVP